jgi:hypothetical protein
MGGKNTEIKIIHISKKLSLVKINVFISETRIFIIFHLSTGNRDFRIIIIFVITYLYFKFFKTYCICIFIFYTNREILYRQTSNLLKFRCCF